MEASEHVQTDEEKEAAAAEAGYPDGKHSPDDEEHTVVGEEGLDYSKTDDSQEPIGADAHGSVTPRSAPDPQHQSGHVGGDQQQGAGEGDGEPGSDELGD